MFVTDDALPGLYTIIAPRRALRLTPRPDGCPFCPGNEEATPAEAGRSPDDGEWSARAFPNLYPITEDGHEVIVASRRHVTQWRELGRDEMVHVISLLRTRIDAVPDPTTWFINDGSGAGASVPHAHAQLLPTPPTPQVEAMRAGVVQEATCTVCARPTLDELLVTRGDGWIIEGSPTPRFAGALRLRTTEHGDLMHLDVETAADAMHQLLRAAPEIHDLNVWSMSGDGGHWPVELYPRNGHVAGFELATGSGVSLQEPVFAAAAARERLGLA